VGWKERNRAAPNLHGRPAFQQQAERIIGILKRQLHRRTEETLIRSYTHSCRRLLR
jgi:hypothetical protein